MKIYFSADPETLNDINWSKALDPTFKENAEKYPGEIFSVKIELLIKLFLSLCVVFSACGGLRTDSINIQTAYFPVLA